MATVLRSSVSLYVDRTSQQWIVRDPDGRFWIVPAGDNGWQQREPLDPDSSIDLEPIPGHYRYLFDFPF